VTDDLMELSARLQEIAARLRAGRLEPDEALGLVEECAQLASEASAQVEQAVRAEVEPLPDLPGQLPLSAAQ
jgi:exonuclease VII small subunit